MTPMVKFTTTAVSHEGCARTVNEDSHLEREDDGLWVVADGMGGHEAGEVASAAIVSALGEARLDGDLPTRIDQIKSVLGAANRAIFRAGESAGARMGSTAAILHISDMQSVCLWAGDSRIYRLREGALSRMTRDHTQVQELVDRGLLTPEEARHHPMGHVISRAVGVMEDFAAEVRVDPVEPNDVFLLCSDGLSGLVTDDELAQHLANSRRSACRSLLDLALERGAPDNVTIVTVACEETTALILEPET